MFFAAESTAELWFTAIALAGTERSRKLDPSAGDRVSPALSSYDERFLIPSKRHAELHTLPVVDLVDLPGDSHRWVELRTVFAAAEEAGPGDGRQASELAPRPHAQGGYSRALDRSNPRREDLLGARIRHSQHPDRRARHRRNYL